MNSVLIFASLLIPSLLPASVSCLENGLGRTPQMGWNSWNHFSCGISEAIVRQTADAIVSTGLSKVGYNYVNIDDCWAESRGSDGNVVPQNTTFPDFQGMIDYVHGKGLKFGLYSDAGSKTCAGRPGSLGYEKNDANLYAKWKVDYLKYDNCNSNGTSPRARYPVMRDALNATGRQIFFSMCEWGVEDPATWAASVGNSWRTTGDINDKWETMINRADLNNRWAAYAGPGGWNDPDMLEVGNGHMNTMEYEMHFSLWCLMKAPLLIGCDITKMSADTVRILTNEELIRINQDPLGVQGKKVKTDSTSEVWAGPLEGGSYAVLLVNRGPAPVTITAEWMDFGLAPSAVASVRDLWRHTDLGSKTGSVSASVPSHGVVAYRITPMKI